MYCSQIRSRVACKGSNSAATFLLRAGVDQPPGLQEAQPGRHGLKQGRRGVVQPVHHAHHSTEVNVERDPFGAKWVGRPGRFRQFPLGCIACSSMLGRGSRSPSCRRKK